MSGDGGQADAYGRRGILLLEQARTLQLSAMARRRRVDESAGTLYRKALQYFEKALSLRPQSVQAARLCGTVLRELGDLEAARARFAQAWHIDAHDPGVAVDYAATLTALNDSAQAIQVLENALQRHPGDAGLHGELALALLGSGQFARGWDEYEWRLRLPDSAMARPVPYRRWRGEPLEGRTLLVTSEQGIGDEIMFGSCFPELVATAGHCVFEVSTRLVSLFERSFPEATIVTRSLQRAPVSLPHVDLWAPAGSVPRFLRRAQPDFPQRGAYLHADPHRTREWRERLASLGAGRKIGLAWSGGLPSTLRAARSLRLEELRPLIATSGQPWVSLEYLDCAAEVEAFNAAGREKVIWWPEALESLEENAALVCALDLVITVTTATAHLAGALGRTAWVMIPNVSSWRYLYDGERMPWYPSLRLFRGRNRERATMLGELREALDSAHHEIANP